MGLAQEELILQSGQNHILIVIHTKRCYFERSKDLLKITSEIK